MKDFTFDTGAVEYCINGKCTVTFNPTDSEFIKRLYDAFETLDKKQEAYRAEVERTADKKKIFVIAAERDKEMREILDGLFDVPVCDALFGSMNVYALANGLPVWGNFVLAIMDELDTTFTREQKATNPRIKKYTEKYNGK